MSFWLEKRAERLVVEPGKASMAEPGVEKLIWKETAVVMKGTVVRDGRGCWPEWRLC